MENMNTLWPEYNTTAHKIKFHRGIEVNIIPRKRLMEPGLTFFIDEENVDMRFTDQPFGNIITDGNLEWMEGKFFPDKNGQYGYCFRPKAYRAEHALVKVTWGGANNNTRGVEWDTMSKLALYSRRCESLGGGSGVNWYVFRIGFVFKDPEMIKMLEEEYNKAPVIDAEIMEVGNNEFKD